MASDHYEAIVQDPVYVGADIGGIYDWDLTTVPQTQLDGAARPLPQGKVLGGGSILNAMCWNRGGSDDYDAWAALGNPGWDWAGLLPYFMKVEVLCRSSTFLAFLTTATERDVYTSILSSDSTGIFDQLQSCRSWNFWSSPSQLSQVFLSSVR